MMRLVLAALRWALCSLLCRPNPVGGPQDALRGVLRLNGSPGEQLCGHVPGSALAVSDALEAMSGLRIMSAFRRCHSRH